MNINESFKKWELFGLNNKREVCMLPFKNIIVQLGDEILGTVATYKNIMEGRFSRTQAPLQVCWIKKENKFLLTDGSHRLVQGLLKGRTRFLCEIEWTGYSLKWKTPIKNDRLTNIGQLTKVCRRT